MHQTAKGDIEQMKDNILISLKDVVVEFDGQRILKGINLDIHDEEFVTFLGPSGCGKTQLCVLSVDLLSQIREISFLTGKKINGVPPYKRNVNTGFPALCTLPTSERF